jgi:hypothetical protein
LGGPDVFPPDEEEEPCDLCRVGSCYAYAGYGPACRSVNCEWFYGEGGCLLAVDREVTAEIGVSAADAVCPFECP